MDRLTQERVAENQSRFRDANERIRDVAEEHRVDIAVPFVCECADADCLEIVRVELTAYAAVRAHPRRFLTAPGHEGEADEVSRVAYEEDGYHVVDKVGHAGDVAEALADGVAATTAEQDEET